MWRQVGINRVTSTDGARIDLDVQELSRLSLKASQ
jgi:hypothetical protein